MSVNYELAKELKDAGFPQNPDCDCPHNVPNENLDDYVYSPRLSELIAACGDDFDSLHNTGGDWWAWSDSEYGEAAGVNESGSTPEEAVARLWLALNKP